MIIRDDKLNNRSLDDAKQMIDQSFPAGRFVAVENGRVMADAESHRQLVQVLQAHGKSPKDMFIVQAGIDYPTSAVIFSVPLREESHG